jgi:tartrate/fumarate subfamily iron-sulfur-dependent hydro-lyase beta chain
MASYTLTVPIPDDAIRQLRAGDTVYLNGVIITGRDAAHKFMVESFVKNDQVPPAEAELYERLKHLLDGGVIYHCGPVVKKDDAGKWHFVAAGPTTSIREEVYQADVIEHFNLKGVIGKGGMAGRTLQACADQPAVYLHAIGGAATLIAQSVEEVEDVLKLEFGVPEAMWVIRVKDFPVVVTMDSHGTSIHDQVEAASQAKFEALLAG